MLDQLIDARTAEQTIAAQLAGSSSKVQQLASDRALALEKLCHSEEKLIALETQLISMEAQLQEKQELLAAQSATLDVASMAAGPLAGACSAMQDLTLQPAWHEHWRTVHGWTQNIAIDAIFQGCMAVAGLHHSTHCEEQHANNAPLCPLQT